MLDSNCKDQWQCNICDTISAFSATQSNFLQCRFGDTMNTAARMEGTNARERIQVSKETADLLIAAKKHHWIKQREDMVGKCIHTNVVSECSNQCPAHFLVDLQKQRGKEDYIRGGWIQANRRPRLPLSPNHLRQQLRIPGTGRHLHTVHRVLLPNSGTQPSQDCK